MSEVAGEEAAISGSLRVRLIADGLGSDAELVLNGRPVVVGRGADADLRIDDRWASRRHCQFERTPNSLLVRDLGSNHGTFVNGQPIQSGSIAPGDRLGIGLSSYRVEFAAADLSSSALIATGAIAG